MIALALAHHHHHLHGLAAALAGSAGQHLFIIAIPVGLVMALWCIASGRRKKRKARTAQPARRRSAYQPATASRRLGGR